MILVRNQIPCCFHPLHRTRRKLILEVRVAEWFVNVVVWVHMVTWAATRYEALRIVSAQLSEMDASDSYLPILMYTRRETLSEPI